jgi:ferredoxin-NADP reductase
VRWVGDFTQQKLVMVAAQGTGVKPVLSMSRAPQAQCTPSVAASSGRSGVRPRQ